MTSYCYLNGEIIPVSDAKVGVYDMGLLRGFGIYEALATSNRRPFMLDAHMERFRRSTDRVGLTIPVTDQEFARILDELIEKNIPVGKEAAIRIILTGGTAIAGIEYDREKPTFYILVEEMAQLPAPVFEYGCSVTVVDHQRQFPESKTINYIEAVTHQAARKAAGALEILYVHEGKMLECATSNFFIVKNGVIATPKENILLGITRKAAIIAANNAGLPVEEREVTVEEMYAADEAFLTSSFKDVVPVVLIGEHAIGDSKPGPTTRKVMDAFHTLLTEN